MDHVPAIADQLTPFMLEGGVVRGRVVRLGAVADAILTRYDYPPKVTQLLGELLAVAALLSANLKQSGVFTLQIRGEGLVPLVVVDAVFGGALRGFAEVSAESAARINAQPGDYSPRALVGEAAYLAITFDPGEDMQRYQGIVALEGDSIAEALTNYFTHSEQLEVEVRLAVSRTDHWRAGGMMIERMPDAALHSTEESSEAWRYARAMFATIQSDELIDPLLDASDFLYRLFHEEGVRIYLAQTLSVGCRCSRERIYNLLMSMSLTDRADMVVNGKIDVHCQFCNKSQFFTPDDVGLAPNQ
jgi:molecular chaperone Hsp33